MTKSELYRMYSGKGPCSMFTEFMLDSDLRLDAVILTEIAAPLEDQYAQDLKEQSKGTESMLKWAVRRAQGQTWWKTAQRILQIPFLYDFVQKLGIASFCRPPVEFDEAQAWISDTWQLNATIK